MLNRLFIAIGVLVILAIGAAFVVPRYIQWGDYRARLESMASEAFGTDVAITGDISLTLLPQPKVEFTEVRVGPAKSPVMSVEKVEAEFSLLDFLRDQYNVTKLSLNQPVVNLAIGADGTLTSGLVLAPGAERPHASVANASITDGVVQLADTRSGRTYAASDVDGELRLEALQGPFSFQGTASLDGAGYGVRVGTGKFDDQGATSLSFYLKAADDSFTLESNGALQSGAAPKYTGDLTYTRPPPKPANGEAADAGRGNFVLESKLEATGDRVLLSAYVVTPDDNRSGTRLTGAAELRLGKDTFFNAVVSGAVIALPPRDATKELADPPYEIVRLLAETPLPPIPSLPGRIGLDITELNLRAVSLRGLRLDAETDGKSWSIKDFAATLPGGATLGLTGDLSVVDNHPIFAGGITVKTDRLDLLASLWRKPVAGSPLFNMPGSLSADVALSSDTLTLSSGTLVVEGINQGFDAQIGFGAMRELKLGAHFTTLGEEESAAIGALLPDITSNGSFAATFPKGSFELSASKAVLFGLQGSDLAMSANWEGGVLEVSKLSAADYGGATFDGKLTAFGTLAKPELSGTGHIKVSDGAPIVGQLLTQQGTPPAVQEFLRRSLPADLDLQLNAPSGDGAQTLVATGRLGTADAKLEAKLSAGLASAFTAPIAASLDLTSQSPGLMTAQLGLGDLPLFDDRTPLHLSVSVDGVPSNSYETHVSLEGGGDHVAFAGNVVPGDFTRIKGDGDLDAKLADPSALAGAVGASGVYLPALEGKAHLQFDGPDSIKLSQLDGGGVSGSLALTRHDAVASITGSLALPALDLHGLVPLLVGASGTVAGDELWPAGPIDIGASPRTSEGRVDVLVTSLTANGAPLISDASFGFDWDAQSIHLRNLSGASGGGTMTFDATVCCSNAALPAKQVTGRLGLAGVPLDTVVPAAIGTGLDGTLDASAQFDGTGETVAEIVGALTGTGSYTINGFSAAHFDPKVFDNIGALTGVVDLTPEVLTASVTEKLAAAPFAAPTVTGSFTIAGGVLRSPNVAVDGTGARIFGGANLSLRTLTLDARYTMTPIEIADAGTALDPTTAEVAAVVTGPVWAPLTSYDVNGLVDGMKIKASEIELARLEKLRAEDEARQKAAAEERARVAAEQAAAEAARKAAEEALASQLAQQAAEASSSSAAAEAASSASAEAAASAAAAAAASSAEAAAASSVEPTPTADIEPLAPPASSSQSPMDLGI